MSFEGLQKDTLELIQKTAVAAEGAHGKAEVLDLRAFQDGCYAVVSADGSVDYMESPAVRTHKLVSIAQIAPLVKFTGAEKVSVWVSETEVVAVFDDDRRKDKATVPLKLTAEFRKLIELAERDQAINPKAFVRILRTKFLKALGTTAEAVIKVFRVLNFGASTSGVAVNQHGKASLGKQIEADIRSADGDIPEVLNLDVRVFEDRALTARQRVQCVVDPDPNNGDIILTPYSDDMAQAMQANLYLIQERILADLSGGDADEDGDAAGIEFTVLLGSP